MLESNLHGIASYPVVACEQAPAWRVWSRPEEQRKNWLRVKIVWGLERRSSPLLRHLSSSLPLSLHPILDYLVFTGVIEKSLYMYHLLFHTIPMLLDETRSLNGGKWKRTVLPTERFIQMLSNGTHSYRLILIVENLYCSIWRKILTVFSTPIYESALGHPTHATSKRKAV